VAGGDRRCFDALYQRLAPSALGLAYTVVRDHAQAEEVAQEVFLELWRTAPRYRPDQDTTVTWTLTLTHRRAVDRSATPSAVPDGTVKAWREVDRRWHIPRFDDRPTSPLWMQHWCDRLPA
jgi:RNA polymerase sigma-70 factor, ECF subfamily